MNNFRSPTYFCRYEFFIVSVGMFTTLDVIVDVLTLASDVVFPHSFKNSACLCSCFLFMSYCLHVTPKRSFSHVRKRNFWAIKFASKRGFIVTVSLQPYRYCLSNNFSFSNYDSLIRVFLTMFISGSSRAKMFCKKSFPRNFAKLAGKHLCQIIFLRKKKKTLTQVFSCTFCEISKNTFFKQNTSRYCFCISYYSFISSKKNKSTFKQLTFLKVFVYGKWKSSLIFCYVKGSYYAGNVLS